MEIILGRSEIDSKKRIEFTILFTATFILQTLEKRKKNYQLAVVERYKSVFKTCPQTPNLFSLSSSGPSSSSVDGRGQ